MRYKIDHLSYAKKCLFINVTLLLIVGLTSDQFDESDLLKFVQNQIRASVCSRGHLHRVTEAVKLLKYNKVADPDGISAEMFKNGFTCAWTSRQRQVPQQWKVAYIVAIYNSIL